MDPALWGQRQGGFSMDLKRSAGANLEQFYIGGRWVDPIESGRRIEIVNPSDETIFTSAAVRAGGRSRHEGIIGHGGERHGS
jgi:hypothetical protein